MTSVVLKRFTVASKTAYLYEYTMRTDDHPSEVEATGPFEVSVTIDEVQNLGAFELELTYDPALLHVDTVTLGDFLGSTGNAASPVGPTIIDNGVGTVTFGGFSFGPMRVPVDRGCLRA